MAPIDFLPESLKWKWHFLVQWEIQSKQYWKRCFLKQWKRNCYYLLCTSLANPVVKEVDVTFKRYMKLLGK